jgi:CheY-like chemotaxis protein
MCLILNVDDNEEILTLGNESLELSGTLVIDTASSAAIAIGKLHRRKYDGILSDYTMPDMNGKELLRYIRTEIGDIPVIMLTGEDTVEVFSLENGADFFLKKSSDIKERFRILEEMFMDAIERKGSGEIPGTAKDDIRGGMGCPNVYHYDALGLPCQINRRRAIFLCQEKTPTRRRSTPGIRHAAELLHTCDSLCEPQELKGDRRMESPKTLSGNSGEPCMKTRSKIS